ncbi:MULTISPECIES: MMPL family transporter [Glaesserella]|uniref:Membrane transport protein MMPL domain-containing protein n=1 Tax=Glaesserella australis TaxID=2094024 RepID=A0A328BZ12_9PAST|nr:MULTISPECIES: hypothetical protein [Glaesserella]AUI66513.1 hypothetical protein CJD39_07960 [Glaesserella sp. 15-184]RAL18687.1 hypothetical protein C5N92_05980 [Glaesserella australis]
MRLNLTACRWLLSLFLVGIVLLFGVQLRSGQWLQTNLQSLLPQEQHWSAAQMAADQIQEQQLNQQIIGLVGHTDAHRAFVLAQHIGEKWQKSQLFQQVDVQTQPDLTQLRHEIQQLSFATLPLAVRTQLIEKPVDYFQQYAEQIVNPFNQTNLLPLEQDWLGFGRFVLPQSQQQSAVQWNAENGMLYVSQGDKTWVLLRGVLAQSDLINPTAELSLLIAESQQLAQAAQAEWLATGSALFAAVSKQQAEQESTLMSVLGVSLTLLLLLAVFRTIRVLWLFLPIGLGMLSGIVATVWGFGQIHILTLVIGTSLIGVLIDFPLHWLSSSLFADKWQGEQAMAKLRFTFVISLMVTLLGYGLLGFTFLPVLKQTALFSSIALLVAILVTALFLPPLFHHYQPRKRSDWGKNLQIRLPKRLEQVLWGLFTVAIVVGIAKSEWKDDIRQWVAMPTEMLSQAKQIGEITGIDLGSQYFLITAENDEKLLSIDKNLTKHLAELVEQGKLAKFQSLSQWIMSETEQKQFATQLATQLKPTDYAILQEIGLPLEAIEQSQKMIANRPLVSLQQALQTTLGQGWKTLYLGKLAENQVGALIKVSGVADLSALTSLADNQRIFWQDKRSHLNQAFEQTRDQAAWLKLLSFALAGLLLWRYFGLKQSGKMLLIPLFAIVATVAVFGWLTIPISLFAMFGLLLVSAIGIDYTAYMQTAPEPLHSKRIAILLAATTTLISFLLLSLSSTPAVASFGMSVSIGILFSLLGTFKLLR